MAPKSRDEATAVLAHTGFSLLKHRIIATTGLQYYADEDGILADHILQRQRSVGCEMSEYFERALNAGGTDELSALIDQITIGETYFFRYPEQFDALHDYLIPERVAQPRHDRTLRIWSAGCASGAEPYSLSIICRRDLTTLLRGWQVSILGTDINRRALAQARGGEFSNWELRTMSEEMKRRCFRPSGKNWAILPEYRQHLRFEHQNLVTDLEPFTKAHAGLFDIILCRNVMIYFASDIMRRVIQSCRECLASGGWLLVGHAEPYLEIANFLAPVSIAGITAYRKEDDESLAAIAGRSWLSLPPTNPEDEPFSTPDDPEGVDAATVSRWMTADASPLVSSATSLTDDDSQPQVSAAASQIAPAISAEQHLAAIRCHVISGDWTIALSACQQAIDHHPLDPRLHYIQALISEHLGSEVAAEKALGRAIYLDRDFALAHYHLGRCLAHRGDRSGAARSFRNALQTVSRREDSEPLAMGDGLKVGELREITEVQLGLLNGRTDGREH